MKIVIYVNYSNKEFSSDFKLSNMLIGMGHNVFLAVNDNQFKELKSNCDNAIIGASCNDLDAVKNFKDLYKVDSNDDISNIICNITRK